MPPYKSTPSHTKHITPCEVFQLQFFLYLHSLYCLLPVAPLHSGTLIVTEDPFKDIVPAEVNLDALPSWPDNHGPEPVSKRAKTTQR